ncbi:MAG: hypothetical protein V1913_15805 [Fibrobacterota bacterium]
MTAKIVKEYDVSLDKKHRCAVRGIDKINKYHVQVFNTGRVVMEPMIMVPVASLSNEAYNMIIESLDNLKDGKVSRAYDQKELAELSEAAEKAANAMK